MAVNAINNFLHNAHLQGLGMGPMSPLTTISPLQLERYHEEQQQGWQKSSKGGGGKKSNVALSALTLLAFLFFLHILQNCIQDHMYEMKGTHKKGYNYNNYLNALNLLNLTGLNLPNVIVLGGGGSGSGSSGSSGSARDNLKGDDAELGVSGAEVGDDQWPLQERKEFKEAVAAAAAGAMAHKNNGFKTRPKQNKNGPKRGTDKDAKERIRKPANRIKPKSANAQHVETATVGNNQFYLSDGDNNMRMHRIDNIP